MTDNEEKRYAYTVQSKVRAGVLDFCYRPLIDVAVSSNTKSRRFKALVDSGTEVTVMDMAIAELLEVSTEGRPRGRLVGIDEYPKEGFLAPVNLQFEEFDKVFTFSTLFIQDLHKNFDIILGQQDFFLNFNVRFERHKKSFYLSLA